MLPPQLFLTSATKITWGSQTFVQPLTLTSVRQFTSIYFGSTPQPTEGRGAKYRYPGFNSKESGSVRCGRLRPRSQSESSKVKTSPQPEGPRERSASVHPVSLASAGSAPWGSEWTGTTLSSTHAFPEVI